MKAMLLTDIFKAILNLVTGFFAIIPQLMYFLYASIGSFLDAMQLVLRKLAGLDVYKMVDVANNTQVEKSGDILKEFVNGILGINKDYAALNVVFWSLIVFSAVLLVLTTIIAIIKAQYNYDEKKSNPMTIVGTAIKSLFTIAITPVVLLVGMYLSEIMLRVVDNITAPSSSYQIKNVYTSDAMNLIQSGTLNNGEKTYTSYDVFGASAWTSGNTFSGIMFKSAAYNCNRVRNGEYTASPAITNSNWDTFSIFYYGDISGELLTEKVAEQIDFAFVNNIQLTSDAIHGVNFGYEGGLAIGSSLAYGPSLAFAGGLINVSHFSKFNVGLVWYYYNLWAFNFFIGLAGVIVAAVLFTNIIFGLMSRLFTCVILAMIYSPLAAITPLDGGSAFKAWREQFMKTFLGVYGAIVGMNVSLILLEFLQTLTFFNVGLLDALFNMLLVLAALALIKKLIAMFSEIIGADDLNKTGESVKKESMELAMSGAKKMLVGAQIGSAALGYSATTGIGGRTMSSVVHKVKNRYEGSALQNRINKAGALVKGFAGRISNKVGDSKFGKALSGAGQKIGDFAKRAGNGIVKAANSKLGSAIGKGIRSLGRGAGAVLGFDTLSGRRREDEIEGIESETPVEEVTPTSAEGTEVPATTPTGREGAEAPAITPTTMVDSTAGGVRPTGTEPTPTSPRRATRRPVVKTGGRKYNILSGVLDLSNSALGVVDSVFGISAEFKKADDKVKIKDSIKELSQGVFQAIGATDVVKTAQEGRSKISTSEQKGKLSKSSANDDAYNMSTSAKRLKETADLMTQAIKNLKK